MSQGTIRTEKPRQPALDARRRRDDRRLWITALAVSLLFNIGFIGCLLLGKGAESVQKSKDSAKAREEQVMQIYPEMIVEEKAEIAADLAPEFVRTSEDQESSLPPPERRYLGERNTQATSDRALIPGAPDLPSQAGIEARSEQLETTSSVYTDGNPQKAAELVSEPVPEPVSASAETTAKKESDQAMANSEAAAMSARERLLAGPNAVELPVPLPKLREKVIEKDFERLADLLREEGLHNEQEPSTEAEKTIQPAENAVPVEVAAKAPDSLDFRGNQTKTAIVGNISRTGRSALDVADSPMGRYQALISRAVELEWQRNCVRHRDFITPGYLTVRFFVKEKGDVESVQFVGEGQSGAVQKGFTLNSIRNAKIPVMPSEVRSDMQGEALELIFNFYF